MKFLALIVFFVAAGYLMREYFRPFQAPPLPAEPPAASSPRDPNPMFSDRELAKIRRSVLDTDPAVRLTAVQLLYSIHDPKLGILLEKMISEDSDPEVRVKIVGMMSGHQDSVRLGGLVRGLSDISKDVRIASLKAIGDIGDPSVVTWVTALLKDPEPDVRVAALQTLGRFQDKRTAEFHALADKLRKDYEEALRHEAARR